MSLSPNFLHFLEDIHFNNVFMGFGKDCLFINKRFMGFLVLYRISVGLKVDSIADKSRRL